MSEAHPSGTFGLGRRGLILLVAILAAIGLYTAVAAGPVSDAKAENFCVNYNAAPYGKLGDRCTAPTWIWAWMVKGYGEEHSACVNAVDVYYNPVTYWDCTGGPGGWAMIIFPCNYIPRKGIVRNNTTGGWTHLAGQQYTYVAGQCG